jgi:hypothetical protein
MARWSSMLLVLMVPTLMAARAARSLTWIPCGPAATGSVGVTRSITKSAIRTQSRWTIKSHLHDGMVVARAGSTANCLHGDALGGPAPAMITAALHATRSATALDRAAGAETANQRVVKTRPARHAPWGRLLACWEASLSEDCGRDRCWRCNWPTLAAGCGWFRISRSTTFDLQLIPDLTDVMLHGTIAAVEPIDMPVARSRPVCASTRDRLRCQHVRDEAGSGRAPSDTRHVVTSLRSQHRPGRAANSSWLRS